MITPIPNTKTASSTLAYPTAVAFWLLSTRRGRRAFASLVAGKQNRRSNGNMNDMKAKAQPDEDEEMQPLYDFSGGMRGKHAQAYQLGHRVVIHKRDGSTEVQEFVLPEGAIILDPDVRLYFPDAESVNRALRGLIRLIPQQQMATEPSA
jgi:hypothetical protein